MVRDKITHLLFGRDVAYNATGMSDVDAGELIVIGKDGGILSAAAIQNLGANEPFYIVEGKLSTNDSHIISPRLTKASIKAHRGTSYAVAVQQVSYIGYNGTTGQLNASNSTEYSLSVIFDFDKDLSSGRRNVRHFNYTSDASATQAEIATALVALMNADEEFAKYATAAVTSTGSDRGISVTGKAQASTAYDVPVQVHFHIVLDKGFDATTAVDEFGYRFVNLANSTTSSASVKPTPGVGTYAAVRALENDNEGFTTGQTNHRKFPIVEPNSRVSSTGTYDMYVIDFVNVHESGEVGISANRSVENQIIIANDISTTSNGTTAAIEALLFAITGVAVNL